VPKHLIQIKKMNEQELKKIFAAHKTDISDDGFSERVVRRLPERANILPQIIMTFFITVGLVITFAVQGIAPLLTQINSLITSISNLQLPSPISVFAYITVLILIGTVGFAAVQVAEE